MTAKATTAPHDYLRRLPRQFYCEHAFVHWSMTIADRSEGWLTPAFHLQFRELHLHTLHRYDLLCPVYCLMPEHIHIFWLGLSLQSDQIKAVPFLRRLINELLRENGFQLQKQPYDSVLRDKDRERGAVESLLFYITENPVRKSLVTDSAEWPCSGSMAVGYPDFDWRMPDFRKRLWTIYENEVRANQESQTPSK